MKQFGEFKLTENAFYFLCEAMDNTFPDLNKPSWIYEIIATVKNAIYQDAHRKHKVYALPLLLKLKCFSEFEMIQLLKSIDYFLGRDDDDYIKIGLRDTSSKFGEIILIDIKNIMNTVEY